MKLVLKQKQGENIETLRQNKNIQVASALLEEKMKAANSQFYTFFGRQDQTGSGGLGGQEKENPMNILT